MPMTAKVVRVADSWWAELPRIRTTRRASAVRQSGSGWGAGGRDSAASREWLTLAVWVVGSEAGEQSLILD